MSQTKPRTRIVSYLYNQIIVYNYIYLSSESIGPGNKSGDGLSGLSRRVETLKNDNLEMAVLIQRLEKEKNDISVKYLFEINRGTIQFLVERKGIG